MVGKPGQIRANTTGNTFEQEFRFALEIGHVTLGYQGKTHPAVFWTDWRGNAPDMSSGSDAGSYLRRIDSCSPQLKAQGPSRTCNESKEEGRTRQTSNSSLRRTARVRSGAMTQTLWQEVLCVRGPLATRCLGEGFGVMDPG